MRHLCMAVHEHVGRLRRLCRTGWWMVGTAQMIRTCLIVTVEVPGNAGTKEANDTCLAVGT